MSKQPLYPHIPKSKQVQFPHEVPSRVTAGGVGYVGQKVRHGMYETPTMGPGTPVRLRSGSQGWIRATIVEYYDVIPVVGGMMYGGGMTPGYKVHILEGKHKGETIRVPTNYVERD